MNPRGDGTGSSPRDLSSRRLAAKGGRRQSDLQLNPAAAACLQTGEIVLSDATKQRGVGALRFRARSSGQCAVYFRYTDSAGKQDQRR